MHLKETGTRVLCRVHSSKNDSLQGFGKVWLSFKVADVAKGPIFYRECGLSRSDHFFSRCWHQGDYTLTSVVETVRKLERPSATQGTTDNFFAVDEEEQDTWDAHDEYSWQKHGHDSGMAWAEEGDVEDPWAGLSVDVALDESTIQTALAVYPAVRDALKRDVLARGYAPMHNKARAMKKEKGKGKDYKVTGIITTPATDQQNQVRKMRCNWTLGSCCGKNGGSSSGPPGGTRPSPPNTTSANYFFDDGSGVNPSHAPQNFGMFIGLALEQLSQAMSEFGDIEHDLEFARVQSLLVSLESNKHSHRGKLKTYLCKYVGLPIQGLVAPEHRIHSYILHALWRLGSWHRQWARTPVLHLRAYHLLMLGARAALLTTGQSSRQARTEGRTQLGEPDRVDKDG
eukprot:6492719-Amphidinium_carterae.6